MMRVSAARNAARTLRRHVEGRTPSEMTPQNSDAACSGKEARRRVAAPIAASTRTAALMRSRPDSCPPRQQITPRIADAGPVEQAARAQDEVLP
jgi:hypothetical protein